MVHQHPQVGLLALQGGDLFPLEVLESQRGFYLGTFHPKEGPCTRESEEYWPTKDQAAMALATGEWTQRICN